ncbi:MAG: N-acetylmuramoyl-L-alanine amidase [Puniceicoccales bacterium]|jgi:N-acetylmuramoyl-L-alanine amidase|nr:N-acetylmuramoyl-L-alanine amidase [Puniceicoccales bacterium]
MHFPRPAFFRAAALAVAAHCLCAVPADAGAPMTPPTIFETPKPAASTAAPKTPPQTSAKKTDAKPAVAAPAAKPATSAPVNLDTTLKSWGFTRVASAKKDTASWRNRSAVFEAVRDKSYLNIVGVRISLSAPVSERNGVWTIPRSDYDASLLPILSPTASTSTLPRRVRHVLLDPGHGGKEPGTQNDTLKLVEKNLTLDVAKRVKAILEKQYGIRVTLTRTNDTGLALADRSALTKKWNTDVFVSIHFNALQSAPTAAGIETYILTPRGQTSTNNSGTRVAKTSELTARELGHSSNTWNVLLGYHLQNSLVQKLKANDRGLRRARFGVLKGTTCPSVLVECGYLSNANEAQKISSPAHRQKIAEAITEGIVAYNTVMEKLSAASKKTTTRTAAK